MRAPGATAGPRWRNVHVVREHDAPKTRWIVGMLAGVVAAFCPIGVYILLQMNYVDVRYQIEELRSQHDRLLEAERRLRTERAALEALPRVEARSLAELGLVRPVPERVVVVRRLRPGSGVKVRAPDPTPPAR